MRHAAILLMLFAILLSSCSVRSVGSGKWVKKIDSEELSRVVTNFVLKAKVDKHLEVEDSRAAYDDYIKKMCFEFTSQRLLTVYDARLLMVEVVEDFLNRINNNKILSFELERFPFTALDLDVKIVFESFYGRYIDELYVGTAWLKDGNLYFYAFDAKDPSLNHIDWKHFRFEPYAKSRELAMLKREADLPYTRVIENPNAYRSRKPNFSRLPDQYNPNE